MTILFVTGTFDLSVGSHARAAQRQLVLDYAREAGMTHLALLIPQSAEDRMSPRGILSRFAGRILSVEQWLAEARRQAQGKQGLSSVFTLGFHHGDFSQFLPLFKADLQSAAAILAAYRSRLLRRRRGG